MKDLDIFAIIRPILGCATDEQYQDVFNRVEVALKTKQRRIDELEAFLREASLQFKATAAGFDR